MKKLLLIATLGIGSLIAAVPAKAQVSLSINIGSQPQWGPTGYNHVDYYYLPEVESYYYVPSRQFIFLSGNRWIRSSRLPARYSGYDLYHGRKVVINSPRPYLHHTNYRSRYGGYGYSRPGRMVSRNNYRYSNRGNYGGHGPVRHDNHGGNFGGNPGRNHGNQGGNHGNNGGNHGGNNNHGGHDNHGGGGRGRH